MTIETKYITLIDNSRGREVPLKIYHPKIDVSSHPSFDAQPPTVIFSHGLGGSMDSYKYYAEFLAANGFMCIHPTHIGIDAELLKGKRPFQVLKEAAEQRENLVNVPKDVSFIITELGLDNVALAGHSYGSYTTLALSGQDVSAFVEGADLADSRVQCAIAISPHAVLTSPPEAYNGIKIPVLHISGKHDDSPFRAIDPLDRRIPFDNISAGNQYLIFFEHADHMIFAAQRRGNKFSANDLNVMKITCAASLEFLKKYLLNADSALDTAEFFAKVQAHGIFEKK